MRYIMLYHKGKRPNNSRKRLKKELIYYIKKEYKKGHIPSRREIQNRFHLRLDNFFKNIDELYKFAKLKYKLNANQNLKAQKASLFLKIILKNLNKFGLNLIEYRNVRERGIDILSSKQNLRVGIELKAYNKYEKLKYRDIIQVEKFIEKEGLDEAVILTSTNLLDKKINKKLSKINILTYDDIALILKDKSSIKTLKFLREFSINREDVSRQIKRKQILDFVNKQYKQKNKKPGYSEILKELHLDIYSYFNSLFEIYKILEIPPPLKNMNGLGAKTPDNELIELWKKEFKKYILSEIEKGNKHPSGEQIGKHFGISNIWNIVKISELYKELGLESYLERKTRIFTSVPIS